MEQGYLHAGTLSRSRLGLRDKGSKSRIENWGLDGFDFDFPARQFPDNALALYTPEPIRGGLQSLRRPLVMAGNNSSKSLPREGPCLSHWQRTTRAFQYLHAHKTCNVPPRSKYVIIGSGISGGLVAFELLEAGVQGEDVVILEAREAASGASSRNAGHIRPGMSCRPSIWVSF